MKLIIIIAGLGGLLYGVDFGVIAAAEPYLMALGIYSGTRVSLVVGAVMLGVLISSLTAGVLCDWLGRKNMLVTLVAAALIDRKGRTWLLKVGTGGMTFGLAAIGSVFLAIERFGVQANNFTGLLTLFAFFFMLVFYALGPGICVWLVLSELMPSRIRANGMAIALFMNQLAACGLASTFRPWVEAWGWSSMFFFFAANGVLYFVTACFIPETKGKSLDELENLFEKRCGVGGAAGGHET